MQDKHKQSNWLDTPRPVPQDQEPNESPDATGATLRDDGPMSRVIAPTSPTVAEDESRRDTRSYATLENYLAGW